MGATKPELVVTVKASLLVYMLSCRIVYVGLKLHWQYVTCAGSGGKALKQ